MVRYLTTGTLIYVPGPAGTGVPDQLIAWFDRTGKATVLPIPAGPYEHPRVSRDGNHVTFSRTDGRDTAVWVYDVAGTGSARRLAFGGRDRFPIWSADSQWVIFQSDRGGDAGLYRKRRDGSGDVGRLTTAAKGTTHMPLSASPDGNALLFSEARADGSTLMSYSFKDGRSAPYGNVTERFVFGERVLTGREVGGLLGTRCRSQSGSEHAYFPHGCLRRAVTRPRTPRSVSRPRGKVAIRPSGPLTGASCSSHRARDR